MNTSQQEWDQFAIKAEIQRRGFTLTGLAKKAGLYEGACRQGLIGTSRVGAQVIADTLDIPFRELFPTLYSRGRHNENNFSQKTTRSKRKKDIPNSAGRKVS